MIQDELDGKKNKALNMTSWKIVPERQWQSRVPCTKLSSKQNAFTFTLSVFNRHFYQKPLHTTNKDLARGSKSGNLTVNQLSGYWFLVTPELPPAQYDYMFHLLLWTVDQLDRRMLWHMFGTFKAPFYPQAVTLSFIPLNNTTYGNAMLF